MRALGRLFQVLALALLPLAIFLELTGSLRGTMDLFFALGFGFALFYIGRICEGYGRG